MKLNVWNGLSIRIIALFAIAIVLSFCNDFLRDFFGDTYIHFDKYGCRAWSIMDDEWKCGYRHRLYFLMCLTLFLIQITRLCLWIDKNSSDFKK